MYVRTADALGFAELNEHFGIPTPTSDITEIFGSYYAPGSFTGFWQYDPSTKIWSRLDAVEFQDIPPFDGIRDDEKRDYKDAARAIADLARPSKPENTASYHFGEPFMFMKFKFQWVFVPKLQRWEILSLGRGGDGSTNQMI